MGWRGEESGPGAAERKQGEVERSAQRCGRSLMRTVLSSYTSILDDIRLWIGPRIEHLLSTWDLTRGQPYGQPTLPAPASPSTASLGLTDCSQVDMTGVQYTSVNWDRARFPARTR